MPDNEDSNAKDVVICYRGVPVLKMPKDIAEISDLTWEEKTYDLDAE